MTQRLATLLVSLWTIAALLAGLIVVNDPDLGWAAKSKPFIRWTTPDGLVIALGPGEARTVETSFTPRKRIGQARVTLSSNLSAYVSVSPTDLRHLKKGATSSLQLSIRVPTTAGSGDIPGTLTITKIGRDGEPKRSASLPVILRVAGGNTVPPSITTTSSSSSSTTDTSTTSTTSSTSSSATSTIPVHGEVSNGDVTIGFDYPPSWRLSVQPSVALLYNPADFAAPADDEEGLGGEETPAISVRLLENPAGFSIRDFALTHQRGWYSYYASKVPTTLRTRAAYRISDEEAQVPHTPIRAIFLDIPPYVLLVVRRQSIVDHVGV